MPQKPQNRPGIEVHPCLDTILENWSFPQLGAQSHDEDYGMLRFFGPMMRITVILGSLWESSIFLKLPIGPRKLRAVQQLD